MPRFSCARYNPGKAGRPGEKLAAAVLWRRPAQLPPFPSGTGAGRRRCAAAIWGHRPPLLRMSFSSPLTSVLPHWFLRWFWESSASPSVRGLGCDLIQEGIREGVLCLELLVLRLSRLARTRRQRCGEDLYLRLPHRRQRRRIGFLGQRLHRRAYPL
jgi:hypothetical protein